MRPDETSTAPATPEPHTMSGDAVQEPSTRNSLLSLSHVSKRFAGQAALDDLNLELKQGEIHALLGQNGSGKSTLIKILSGYHRPEAGAIARFNGQGFALGHTGAAQDAGIRFIHQDLGLISDLDIVDNLAIGTGYNNRWWLSDRRERRRAELVMAEHDMSGIDVGVPVKTLTPARQSMLAIVRAVHSGLSAGGLLVLDEPTAALPEHETEDLFKLLRSLRDRAVTILYVTHRLAEVFAIADRVSVMREGRRVATADVGSLSHERLVELIIGQPVTHMYPEVPPAGQEVLLEVNGLRSGSVEDATFTVKRGEIVGVTGLLGSGYEDLLSTIAGGSVRQAGTVRVAGLTVPRNSPQRAIRAGLAFAPADRKRLAAISAWTLRENITLPAIPAGRRSRWLGKNREAKLTAPWLSQLRVAPPDTERIFSTLSGGNQQKVILARWLRCGAKVLLLDEPTNGVDVGAKPAIYQALADVAKAGSAVVLASSDLEELSAVCDRILIMREGRLAAELSGTQLGVASILGATLGQDRS